MICQLIVKYQDTIVKVCTNIQSDDCDLSANREIPGNNCEGSHCEIEINEGPDTDTSNWKLHGSIHTWAQTLTQQRFWWQMLWYNCLIHAWPRRWHKKYSDDKYYDTIVSFMQGPRRWDRTAHALRLTIVLTCGPHVENPPPSPRPHHTDLHWGNGYA